MSEVTFNRRGERVYEGILPPWWDTYDVTYDDVNNTETYTYSAINTDSGQQEVQAIIVVTYASPLKDRVTQVKKIFNAPGAY